MDLARIGKYEIVSRIGQGAMGEVYKAHDPVLNRFVAIKTMAGVLTADDQLVERFRREAQSAARLNHVNIVTVYDFGEEQGHFYMAMELLEGVDLKEVIGTGGLNDLWDKLDVMEQIADGLAFAHAQGVVHRDLKPANIRLLPSGRVKIMDFGLARLNTSEMTRTGMVMGTPNYMSPEQVRGERADARSDVFSLGAVFYEMLAGRKAFQADSMHTILFKVLEEHPEPVERIVPDLPPRFVRMIERALEKDPVRRFQHAGEMRDSLRLVRASLADGEADATVAGHEETAETMVEGAAPTIIERAGAGRAVDGATALDVTRLPAPARPARPAARPAATLSGRSPTHPPRRRELSRAAVFGIAAVVAGLAVGGTLLWWAQRPGPDAPQQGDITSAQVGALTAQLVGNTIELARADLQNKDYRGAIAQAERALRLDPESGEARQVIDDANRQLAALEQNAAAATAAYRRGDTEAATRALGLVLAIDPRHPAATELTAALNQHFRRQAEDARRAVEQAREAAASASGQEAFTQADRARAEAEALLRKDEFAVATQRLLQARDGFERARRNADAEARAQAQAAARAAAAAAAPVTTPRGQAAVAAPPITLPPPGTVPPAVIEAPPAATGAPGDDAGIRKVIADYARAIEGKDLALFRAVKPNLSGEEAKRLQDSFKAIKSQKVGITIDSIQVDGAQATVRVSRQDTINGQAMRAVSQTFRLAQGGPGWTIQTIGQ
jgi:tetratricopeptide (TPR) repeat protein